jgi:biopolymer transport protein ExbD
MSLNRTIRKKPELDMNPMVDMAFLLVSFFMMTTTFKANLPEEIQIPASSSEIKLPESGMCTITVGESGNVYFSMDNKFNRKKLLERMGSQYNLEFTDQQMETFSLMGVFGVPIAELPALLNAEREQKPYPQPGIPAGVESNELNAWILTARMVNPNLRFAVNADRDTKYPSIHALFETLRDLNITRFNLVTDTKKTNAAQP